MKVFEFYWGKFREAHEDALRLCLRPAHFEMSPETAELVARSAGNYDYTLAPGHQLIGLPIQASDVTFGIIRLVCAKPLRLLKIQAGEHRQILHDGEPNGSVYVCSVMRQTFDYYDVRVLDKSLKGDPIYVAVCINRGRAFTFDKFGNGVLFNDFKLGRKVQRKGLYAPADIEK